MTRVARDYRYLGLALVQGMSDLTYPETTPNPNSLPELSPASTADSSGLAGLYRTFTFGSPFDFISASWCVIATLRR